MHFLAKLLGNFGMARRTRRDKQASNGLRDEPIEQPPPMHESYYQSPVDQLMIGTSQAQVEPTSSQQHEVLMEHESIESSDNIGNANKSTNLKKRTRGPTYMKEIWGRPSDLPRINVELDDKGLPINEKTQFSEFLGSLARNGRYCPIDIEKWPMVSKKQRMEMLDVIKERFDLPPGIEAWTLRSIGKKWRSWKSELKATYYNPSLPLEEVKFHKNARVQEEQWIKLWAYWGTEEAKKVSKRNKDARQKKNMNHTTGKKSFAVLRSKMTKELGRFPSRVEMFDKFYSHADGTPSSSVVAENLSKMKEKSSQLPSDAEDPVSQNDIFAQVIGKDKHGHVRLFGEGVNPTDIWGDIPSRSMCHRINLEQQATLSRMEDKMKQQDEDIANLKKQVQQLSRNSTDSPRYPSSSSTNVSGRTPTNQAVRVGSMVQLKSLFDPTKVVAKGDLRNMNPSHEVGGQVLGSNWYEVNVQVAVDPHKQLIRPYDLLQTIQDALGAPLAWPCHLVAANIEE